MQPLSLLVVLATLAAPRPAGSEAPELSLCIERVAAPELAVLVHEELTGDADGVTDLGVQRSWGGVEAGGEDLEALRATGAAGQELAVERLAPHRWRVGHAPGERLSVVWRLAANAHQDTTDPDQNRRPIVNERVFHAYGYLFLPLPEHLEHDARRRLRVAWEGFGEGAGLACSFGVGPGPHDFEASLDELGASVFLGGEVRLLERHVQERPVWVAAEDRGWAFRLEDLADLVALIVEAERGFFEDWDAPFWLVSLIPVGAPSAGSSTSGGTGLHQSFAMQAQPPGGPLEPGSRGYVMAGRLLAHEMFHQWNGRVLGRAEDEEQLVYWFSEGFTDFYARRLLLRSGAIGVDDYLELLNESLRRFHLSPVRGAPNARILADFWNDPAVRDLPYVRGDVVAIVLDHAIRERSGGERSLDDLMRSLVERARREGWRISTAALLDEFERWTSPEVAAELRAVIEDGALPRLAPATFAPCLELTTTEEPGFDPGFDLERSIQERVVHGVRPGGPAETAGLRDGQPIAGFDVHHGRTDRPLRIHLAETPSPRTVEFLPQGTRITVPRFVRAAGAGEACPAL